MPAPTFSNLTANGASSATSFTTASVAPTGNRLILISIHAYISTGSVNPATPTVTGNGITYTLVKAQDTDNSGTDRGTIFVFRGMAASPSSGTITIDWGATTMTRCQWAVDQSDANVDTSGSNGSGAIVQNTGVTSSGTGTSNSVNFSSAMTSGNTGFSAWGHQATEGKTPRTSWSEIADTFAVSLSSVETQYIAGTDTAGSASWTSTVRSGGIIIEVKAGGATDATVTPSVVAATAAVPAPTVQTDETVTPSAVAAVAALPAPTVKTDQTVTPAVVAAVAALPAPSVSTGSNATVTPAVISVVGAVPAPTVQTDSTAAVAAVAAVGLVPAPTVQTGSTVTPGAIMATAVMLAPTIQTGVTVAPSVVAAVVVVPSPTITVPSSATVTPSVLALMVVLSAPAVHVTAPVPPGSWSTILIAKQLAQEYRTPVACPNDGTPLQSAPHGELFCPFDGWQFK